MTSKYLCGFVTTFVVKEETVLGGGAPVGGIETEAVIAVDLVGGDNEGAAA